MLGDSVMDDTEMSGDVMTAYAGTGEDAESLLLLCILADCGVAITADLVT